MSDLIADGEVKTKKDELELKYLHLLSQKLSSYRNKGKYCDVRIKIGDKTFKCHRNILAANSKYFVSFFKDNFKEANDDVKTLPEEYVDKKSFSKLLDAMYGQPLEINDDLIPLFTTSLYLQLTHFVDHCKQFISDNLDTIDIIELIMLPQLKFDRTLYTMVKKYICQNFPRLYLQLAGITFEVFEDLILDPELFALNKEQVLEFGQNWICFDVKNRKQHLQKVALFLKPFHTLSERSLDLVSKMGSLLHNDYHVKIALNTLLESSDTRSDKDDRKLEMITHPFFFVQPNNDSEVMFGTYKENAWVFLNELKLPIRGDLLNTYEGAVANNVIYFSAKYNQAKGAEPKVIYRGLTGETKEWTELISPRGMPTCLVTCNSMVYSYEDSLEDHQVSVFEPLLNRWFRAPAVTYPRSRAGLTSDDYVLYMVGGIPLKKIATESPTNIIEMFDSRSRNWSRISVPNTPYTSIINNEDYSKKVCFLDKTLYMINSKGLFAAVDIRNNKWILAPMTPVSNTYTVQYLTAVNQQLWFIYENSTNGIKIVNGNGGVSTSLSNPNVFLQPIALPSWV